MRPLRCFPDPGSHRTAATLTLVLALLAAPVLSCDSAVGPDEVEGPFELAVAGTIDGRQGLHLVREDGTGATAVTPEDVDPRWYAVSPDGRKVAVLLTSAEIGTDLFVVDRDGSGLINLTNTPEQWDGWISWSPDGARLAYSQPVAVGGEDVWVVDADGSSPTNLTPPQGGHREGGAVWSPDGSRLAFVSHSDGGRPDIFVMDADGSNRVNLTRSPDSWERWPAWSPDGSRIAFSRTTNDAPRDIYVVNPDGTGLANLSQNPARDDEGPLWSPDGSQLLFMAASPGAHPEIMVMNADGTDALNISDHPALDFYASWSPDGAMVAFTSFRDGLRQVYIANADGTELRRLIEPGPGETPRENWLESMAAWAPAPM